MKDAIEIARNAIRNRVAKSSPTSTEGQAASASARRLEHKADLNFAIAAFNRYVKDVTTVVWNGNFPVWLRDICSPVGSTNTSSSNSSTQKRKRGAAAAPAQYRGACDGALWLEPTGERVPLLEARRCCGLSTISPQNGGPQAGSGPAEQKRQKQQQTAMPSASASSESAQAEGLQCAHHRGDVEGTAAQSKVTSGRSLPIYIPASCLLPCAHHGDAEALESSPTPPLGLLHGSAFEAFRQACGGDLAAASARDPPGPDGRPVSTPSPREDRRRKNRFLAHLSHHVPHVVKFIETHVPAANAQASSKAT